MIHHYTTIDAFCKILNSYNEKRDNTFIFWASDAYSMNDPMEMEYGYHFLMKELSEIEKEKSISPKLRLSDYMKYLLENRNREDTIESLMFKRMYTFDKTPFVISFSHAYDTLPMWNMYGNNGNGICLSFNEDKLNGKDFIQNEGLMAFLFNVIYMEQENPNPATLDIIKKMIKHETENYYDNIDTNDLDNFINKNLRIGSMFRIVNPFLKNKTYAFEKEERLVVHLKNNIDLVKFRMKGTTIIPYVEVPIPIDSLEGITLGPCAKKDTVKNNIEFQLSSCNLNIKIKESDIPYRII